ncbi:MAG: GntR family transcriptional regulator [Lachnospiraceae bacterium]|nr:GntR family transcriptional regulator [Lachnospiraceae bacterium]
MDVTQTISFSKRRPSEDSRQYAYRTIREAILLFVLEPGVRLSEPELASWLSLSRTPVHDALERLEREKLTVSGSAPGFYVKKISALQIRNALWLMELFTTEVIHAFFTERVATQKIEILQFMLKETERAVRSGNARSELRITSNFFTQMYTFGGSFDYLWSALQKENFDLIRLLYLIYQEKEPSEKLLHDMNDMIDALIRRDDEAACQAEHASFTRLANEAAVLQKKYPDFFDGGEDREIKAQQA